MLPTQLKKHDAIFVGSFAYKVCAIRIGEYFVAVDCIDSLGNEYSLTLSKEDDFLVARKGIIF